MTFRRLAALAAIVAAPMMLAGCDNDAEEAVQDVAGVEEGTNTRTADVDEETYVVEEIDRIKKADTGEVVGEQIKETEVTVKEEVEVQEDVEVKSSETSTETRGYVPDELDDQ